MRSLDLYEWGASKPSTLFAERLVMGFLELVPHQC